MAIVRILWLFIFVQLALGSWSCPGADAHRVYVFAWVEGETVFTESYFSSRSPVVHGKIQVFDLSGQKLLEGTTDSKGMFSFNYKKAMDLKIVLDAGMGHRAEYVLRASEFPEKERENNLSTQPESPRRGGAPGKQETGPGIPEILVGLGLIFVIMAVAMYLWPKRRT